MRKNRKAFGKLAIKLLRSEIYF